ncbi:hypothetical protein [Novipirellula artificiosorum]|uniref:PSP1 C-terminal domain-containing protein n=1 Tax=Novipirellula artificiosorum TaxID=2528016 RepID=A0A5C6D9U1_9BACT|nr:hypothetical protein [Novipirellula artificiosorum]TWU32564.1 hypothetical protein Poly41_55420 [Novipirellula artificiosorum]
MGQYFVRIGSLGELFIAQTTATFRRGVDFPCENGLKRADRVIVRTGRGVELAVVVSPIRNLGTDGSKSPLVTILRKTTEPDELLIRRLDRHRRAAIEGCRSALSEAGSAAILLDVDQLFDGGTLIMQFLGPVDSVAESISAKVTAKYESIVRSRHFAKLLQHGCGPDCGTDEGIGCGGSCSGCGLACGKLNS